MKKALFIMLSAALIVCATVAGTLAWLTDTTDHVVNTFTVGDINITLTESEDLDLKMVPGRTITKDPKVTVKEGSEACWLFVKVVKSGNFDSFMTFEIANGWTELTEGSGVYYAMSAMSLRLSQRMHRSMSFPETRLLLRTP